MLSSQENNIIKLSLIYITIVMHSLVMDFFIYKFGRLFILIILLYCITVTNKVSTL